jgi:hypothetical protein
MSCCGNRRAEFNQANSAVNKSTPDFIAYKKWSDVYFEYTGETGLTITGTISRIRYRFNFKGDRQLIDYRDVGSVSAIPLLKRVKQ